MRRLNDENGQSSIRIKGYTSHVHVLSNADKKFIQESPLLSKMMIQTRWIIKYGMPSLNTSISSSSISKSLLMFFQVSRKASTEIIEFEMFFLPRILECIKQCEFPYLQQLTLRNMGIESIQQIQNLNAPNLTTLDLTDNNITNFKTLHKSNKIWTHLYLNCNPCIFHGNYLGDIFVNTHSNVTDKFSMAIDLCPVFFKKDQIVNQRCVHFLAKLQRRKGNEAKRRRGADFEVNFVLNDGFNDCQTPFIQVRHFFSVSDHYQTLEWQIQTTRHVGKIRGHDKYKKLKQLQKLFQDSDTSLIEEPSEHDK